MLFAYKHGTFAVVSPLRQYYRDYPIGAGNFTAGTESDRSEVVGGGGVFGWGFVGGDLAYLMT